MTKETIQMTKAEKLMTEGERIYLSDIWAEYVPDYRCMLIPIQKYSNSKIIEKKDELSLLMLMNKLSEAADFKELEKEIPREYLQDITMNTPEYLLNTMAEVISGLLSKLDISREEVEVFVGQIKERKMGDFFSNFKGYDVPATRKEAKLETAREFVLELLEELGDIPDSLKNRIMREDNIEALKSMLKIANNSHSIEEFENKI